MEADDIERYLAELGAELKNRGIKMIVLYCSRKHKFGHASKPNKVLDKYLLPKGQEKNAERIENSLYWLFERERG